MNMLLDSFFTTPLVALLAALVNAAAPGLGGSKLPSLAAVSDGGNGFEIDMSIEGMNSQEFSVAIFYFLIVAIAIFTVFVFMFMFKDRTSKLKPGEKWLFAWILFGIVFAIIFGATQMLHGYLF